MMHPPNHIPHPRTLPSDRRNQWLLDNPQHMAWLAEHVTPTRHWSRDVRAELIVRELRQLGIYSRHTTVCDACGALRNASRRLMEASARDTALLQLRQELTPTAQAVTEIAAILSRPGVERARVIQLLQS